MRNDNPIFNVVNSVLGLGGAPKTFSEKIDRLADIYPEKVRGTPRDFRILHRLDKGLSSLHGSIKAQSQIEVESLFNKLSKSGIVPPEASALFESIGKSTSTGGSLFYNEATNALFYGTKESILPLPTQNNLGLVQLGNSLRQSYSIGRSSFASNFYSNASSITGDTASILRELKTNKSLRVGLIGSANNRGLNIAEEGFFSSRRFITDPSISPEFAGRLYKQKIGQSAFAKLIKTGGRYIDDDLRSIDASVTDVQSAFAAIRRYKDQYIEGLGDFIDEQGGLSSVPFIKPEYLGSKSKFLIGRGFADAFGTSFEQHTLNKGLFQLNKMRVTTEGQVGRILSSGLDPYAPFLTHAQLSDPLAARRRMGLRVGVVDFADRATELATMGEGGIFLTQSGANKFATTLPMGSIKLTGVTEEEIGAAQRLFGVNLGTSNKIVGINSINFANEADFNILRKSSRKYRGLWNTLKEQNASLAKIELTDAGLNMDFVTPGPYNPGTMEGIIGARRGTMVLPGRSNPMRGIISSPGIDGAVDVLMGADEFHKTFGPQVFLDHAITTIKGKKNAESIFRQVFGENLTYSLATSDKGLTHSIPLITNIDDAYKHSFNVINQWNTKGTEEEQRLAREILHGTEVINKQMLQQGIKGMSIFNMSGAMRTDFMGDINMMNPVRFTASKLVTMASGSKMMGYKSHYDDPLVNLLMQQSFQWRNRFIGIRAGSGELFLSNKHTARRFAKALMGKASPSAGEIVTMGPGGFYLGGNKLKNLPNMSDFLHSSGGVPLSDLKDTLLDPKNANLLFLDLGENKGITLKLGKDTRKLRYIPIPREYLRTNKGLAGNVVLGKDHPSYRMIESLIDLERNDYFFDEQKLSAGLGDITRALGGKKGLLDLTSTIRVAGGTRARLSPSRSGYHNAKNFLDPETFFTGVISESEFEEFLNRKSGMASKQVSYLRARKKAGQTEFLATVGVDPMQRGEHAGVFKIKIDPSINTSRSLGQLNLELHSGIMHMFERDVDRDAANLVFLEGLHGNRTGLLNQQLEKRLATQQKMASHFMWFYKYDLMTKPTGPVKNRLMDMTLGSVRSALETYLGIPKSFGYTIARSSETIMRNLIAYGGSEAEKMGIAKHISPDMINSIRAPFVDDPLRFSAAQQLLQNLYQGAVKKAGSNKMDLTNLAEQLVNIGQKYKGSAFNYEAAIGEGQGAIKNFLNTGDKNRHFLVLDYMVEKGMLSKESTEAVKADLERGTKQVLDEAAQSRIARYSEQAMDTASRMMAEILVPGMAIQGSIRRSPKNVQSVMQRSIEEGEEFSKVLSPLAGNYTHMASSALDGYQKIIENTKKANAVAEAVKNFAKTDGGHFLLGLGVGALGGAALMGMMSGPEAPMPRDIDSRQPTDVGPAVYSKPPRIYGTNQTFAASRRRSAETFSPVAPYSFGVRGESNITIRDKTQITDPRLLQMQMKNIANSDFNY